MAWTRRDLTVVEMTTSPARCTTGLTRESWTDRRAQPVPIEVSEYGERFILSSRVAVTDLSLELTRTDGAEIEVSAVCASRCE